MVCFRSRSFRRARWAALCGVALMLAAARPAHGADACPPLQLLNVVPMAPANGGTVLLVPVTINGSAKLMIFDTGSAATSLTEEAAQELDLRIRHSFRYNGRFDARNISLYDVNGEVSRDSTTIEDLKFGGLENRGVPVKIWPDPDLGKVDSRLAGVLSRDLLFQYDLDVDFGAATLKLFSPDHCEGRVLYWPASAVTEVAFDTAGGHINIPVTLDGQTLTAIIDTGASVSALNANVAEREFGLTGASADMQQAGTLAHNALYPVYRHTFTRLDFGGVSVSNPVLSILPDMVTLDARRNPRALTRLAPLRVNAALPQVIIGMDILKELHAYIAVREKQIYISATAADARVQAPKER